MVNRLELPAPPPGWGGDGLSAFMDLLRANAYGSFNNLPQQFYCMRLVDDAYSAMAGVTLAREDWMRPLFIRKSHAIFRAGAHLAVGGQFSEIFVLLRSCLESALCAHYLHVHQDLQPLWLARHESEDNRKKVRKAFQSGRLKEELRRAEPEVFERLSALYEMCIDLGGHPNEKWLTATLREYETDGEQQFYSQYLTDDPDLLIFGMDSCSRVGLAALQVYGLLFPERWAELPMKDDLVPLSDHLFADGYATIWNDS